MSWLYQPLLPGAAQLQSGGEAGGGPVELQGSINAQSRLGAAVTTSVGEQSGDSGQSSINGSLSITKSLVGQINGKSTLGSALITNVSSGVSSTTHLDGNLSNFRSFVGDIRSKSTIGAATNKHAAENSDISGDSEFDGDLTNLRLLVGDIRAKSTLGVALNKNANIDTSVSGDSDFDGHTALDRLLVSDLRGRSSFSGSLTVVSNNQLGFKSLLAYWLGGAGISSGVISLAGAIRAISRLGGDVYKASGQQSSDFGNAQFNGLLSLTRQIFSDLKAKSTLGAAVNKNAGNNTEVSGDSDFDGNLSSQRSLIGAIRAQSTLGVALNKSATVSTAVSGDSDFDGNLSTTKSILASLSAYSTFGVALNKGAGENSQISGDSDFDGALSTFKLLVGQIFGRSIFNGDLVVQGDDSISAGISAKSRLGADIKLDRLITGNSSGANDWDSSLNVFKRIESGPKKQLRYQIQSGNDDAHARADGTNFNETATSHTVGRVGAIEVQGAYRWINLQDIVKKIVIESHVSFKAAGPGDEPAPGTTDLHLHFENEDSPDQMIDNPSQWISRLSNSTSGVEWLPPVMSIDQRYDTPNISISLQEVINRVGFNGTSVNFFVHDHNASPDRYREFYNYDNSQQDAAELYVTVLNDNLGGTSLLNGVLSNAKSIISNIDGISRFGADATRAFSINSGISTHASADGNLNLLKNIISSINAKSSLINTNVFYLVGLNTGVNSKSSWDASTNLSSGIVGGISGTPSLSLGILVDRQLLSQLYGLGLLNGELTVISIPTSFETVNFTLHIMKQKDIGLAITKLQDLNLNIKSGLNITLER